MKILKFESSDLRGGVVISGEKYFHHTINIVNVATATVELYIQLLDEDPALEHIFVSELHTLEHRNFERMFIIWAANAGDLTIMVRQYGLIGD